MNKEDILLFDILGIFKDIVYSKTSLQLRHLATSLFLHESWSYIEIYTASLFKDHTITSLMDYKLRLNSY